MQRNLAEAIRQQSDDLREALKDLEQWEEEVEKDAAIRKSQRTATSTDAVEPPIRGTVPSIKQAIAEATLKDGKRPLAAAPESDPINIAKEKGNEYFRLGKVREAIEAYTSGIDLSPHSSTTYLLYGNRAMCYLKTMQWAEAEKDATTCLQMNRSYAKAYFRRAVARKQLGKLKDARSDLEATLALVPEDEQALAELEVVTRMVQAERAKGSTAAPVKKRIIIEEVDEEDEEEEEERNGHNAEAVAGRSGAPAASAAPAEESDALSVEERQLRDGRISAQMKELERVRKLEEEKARLERIQAEQAMEARRRRDVRVEVMDEEDIEADDAKATPPPTQSTPPPPSSSVPVSEAARPVEASEKKSTAVHKDPVGDVKASSPPAETREGPAERPASMRAQRRRSLPSIDSLVPPKSFTELERVFPDIEKDDTLRNHYVGLMNPTTFPAFFGSNLSPEMLVGLLRSISQMPAATAAQFLKGLGAVNRVEDLTLFFDVEEKKLVEDALAAVKTSNLTEKELGAIKRKLKPF